MTAHHATALVVLCGVVLLLCFIGLLVTEEPLEEPYPVPDEPYREHADQAIAQAHDEVAAELTDTHLAEVVQEWSQ